MTLLQRFLISACLFIASAAAHAQQQDIGDYTVHYIAVNSTFLTPAIAQQYDIVRSERRAFVNISVLRNNDDGSTTPVTAVLNGSMNNLLQQSSPLAFKEIREGDAIYYLGQFDFSNAELLRFSVEVQPEGTGPAYTIEWQTQLYMN